MNESVFLDLSGKSHDLRALPRLSGRASRRLALHSIISMSLVDRSNSLSRPNGEERIRDIFLGIPVDVLPQIHSRLELRTIIVQAGKQLTLPMQYEGVLELRAGSLATGTENNRVVHRRGEMGQVSKGDRVTLQASGELAVLRAIYLVPGEK